MAPRISAVIPVRNNADDLSDAVESVLAQPHVFEVLLCVGPSHDGSEDVAARLAGQHEPVRVLENEHGGIPQALNLGLGAASGAILLRLDAHSVLPADYVENALETYEAEYAANVGAVQRPVGQTRTERAIAAAMGGRAGSGGAAYREGSERRVVDTAFLGFFDIAVLRSIGGWDERFARNEDAELNIRISEAGHHVWLDPRLVVDYRPRDSLRALANQYWHYGWWRLQTIRAHPRSLKLRQLAAPVIVIVLAAGIVLAALVSPWWLLIPGAYISAVLAAGLASAGPIGQRLVTGAALVTMHLSWGTNFLRSALASLFRRG
ncbi:MAG: glycosyltransferase [Actinomycetota bacterium]